jgi:hypothetical protein
MSDSDIASLFQTDLASVRPAAAGDVCPLCQNPPADSHVQLFVFDPARRPDRVEGRVVVKCLCRTVYSYAAIHDVSVQQPIGEVRVRSTSPPVAPAPPPPSFEPGLNPALSAAIQHWRNVADQRHRAAAAFYVSTGWFQGPPVQPKPEVPNFHLDYCGLCGVKFVSPRDVSDLRICVGAGQSNAVRLHKMAAPQNCTERWDAGERPPPDRPLRG